MKATSQQFTDLITQIFKKAGMTENDASSVASLLVDAEQRGLQSHGVLRVGQYLNNCAKGGAKIHPEMKILKETETTAVIDADYALGAVSSEYATDIAREKAKKYGIGYVVVKNCNHFGMGAHWTLKMAQDDMIGITGSTVFPGMPAPGGVSAVVGNNPFGIAVNSGKYKAIAIDQATSVSAMGKALALTKQGKPIPAGWFYDENGEYTSDMSKVRTLVPMAGHKGYGIAFGIEILAGMLAGGVLPQDMHSQGEPEKSECANQFFMAIDIAHFRDVAQFHASLDSYIDFVKQSKLKPGVEKVMYPGEIECDVTARSERDGLQVADPICMDLVKTAQRLGVEEAHYSFLQ